MFKKKLSFKRTLLVSFAVHISIFFMFSIATVKVFYPRPKYIEISLGVPPALKYFKPNTSLPIKRVSYNTNDYASPNFFYCKRKTKVDISLTSSKLSNSGEGAYLINRKLCPTVNIHRMLRIASPEQHYWMKQVAVEKELKLKVYLSPDGRVNLVNLRHSSGNPYLDHLIKEAVAQWRFEPLNQHD